MDDINLNDTSFIMTVIMQVKWFNDERPKNHMRLHENCPFSCFQLKKTFQHIHNTYTIIHFKYIRFLLVFLFLLRAPRASIPTYTLTIFASRYIIKNQVHIKSHTQTVKQRYGCEIRCSFFITPFILVCLSHVLL